MRTSVVRANSLKSKDAYRIDSEFWEEELILNEASVRSQSLLRDLVQGENSIQTLSDTTKSLKYLEIGDVALDSTMYQLKDIHPGSIPDRAKYLLKRNDVVVSTVRPIRNAVALVRSDNIVGSSGFAILRPNSIPSEFLWVFCKTDYFKKYLVRRQRNSMYPAVTANDVLNAPVFPFTRTFQKSITSKVRTSNDLLIKCHQKYRSLQREVLEQMGLQFDGRSGTNTFLRPFSNVDRASRFDAKFFDPDHSMDDDAYSSCVRTTTLAEISSIEKGVEVGKDQYIGDGVPFVRVSDIGRFSLKINKLVNRQVYDQYKLARIRQGDILMTKDATLGMIHHVYYKPKPMLVSSGIVRLRTRDKSVPTYYLGMVLDSRITTNQIERESSGSNISHWNLERVRNCRIPLLSAPKMKAIDERVRKIFMKVTEAQKGIGDAIKQLNRCIDNQ